MSAKGTLGNSLTEALQNAGYYPQLTAHMIHDVLYDEKIIEHCVHMETHVDFDSIHRHVTAFAITHTRLILVHVDDEPAVPGQAMRGIAGVEEIPLHQVQTVVLGRMYVDPANFTPEQRPVEVSLTLGWNAMRRMEVYPESCGDPQCEGDHGYGGSSINEDVSLRVSAQAEGQDAVDQAERFALTLKKMSHHARLNSEAN